MKLVRNILLCLGAACIAFAGQVQAEEDFITLASTTSTQASGFFDYYLPLFQRRAGIEVRVVAVGTGQALKIGENGDADVLLVHDRIGELQFIRQGYGIDRREVMYNDFVVVGPEKDPARIDKMKNAVAALQKIANSGATFVSRGDDSGTNRLERRLWKVAGIDPGADRESWYKEAGAGMGAVLNMTAASGNAYTISDRATWLAFQNKGDLVLLVQGDPRLFNQYSLMLVNPEKHPHVKKRQALLFMDWMTSAEGQRAIGAFQMAGQTLFYPNAQKQRQQQ